MTDKNEYPPLTPDENGKVTISAQLVAFDVVNGNKRIYSKDCFKLPKTGFLSAEVNNGELTGEMAEEFNISLRSVVGFTDTITATDEGLFAVATLSMKTPNGALALEGLNNGYVFAPRGSGTTSIDENGNTRIDSINIFGYNTWTIDKNKTDEQSKD